MASPDQGSTGKGSGRKTIGVHVHGARGRMGSMVVQGLQGLEDIALTGTSDRGDDLAELLRRGRPAVMVDFTVAEAAVEGIALALDSDVSVVSGTTGIPGADVRRLGEMARSKELGLLLAPNFCIGVVLLQRFARQAAAWFADVEIVELHHERKVDAPSGTALATARQIARAAKTPVNADRPPAEESHGSRGMSVDGVPVHAVRLPGLLAHQEVLFGAPGQILTLRHDTSDRRAFLPGILLGVRAIGRRTGLVDSLEALLDDFGS